MFVDDHPAFIQWANTRMATSRGELTVVGFLDPTRDKQLSGALSLRGTSTIFVNNTYPAP